jgi:hypothetical protein
MSTVLLADSHQIEHLNMLKKQSDQEELLGNFIVQRTSQIEALQAQNRSFQKSIDGNLVAIKRFQQEIKDAIMSHNKQQRQRIAEERVRLTFRLKQLDQIEESYDAEDDKK